MPHRQWLPVPPLHEFVQLPGRRPEVDVTLPSVPADLVVHLDSLGAKLLHGGLEVVHQEPDASFRRVHASHRGHRERRAVLILGDQDSVLGEGAVAEFDTRTPHWFGSTGQEPAEVLSVFSRPGERMHGTAGSHEEPDAAPNE
jgi:hypothetical protein